MGKKKIWAIGALLMATAVAANADDGDSKLKFTGFLDIVGGSVVSGSINPNTYTGPSSILGVDCPCYVADWSNAGIYGNGVSLTPESRVGIQANYQLTPKLSLVGQVVSRASDNGKPSVEWAYASYRVDPEWEIQFGRKRIPLYYYSDFQDIGIAYPWVSTPAELYGWDATNYDGASARFTKQYGSTSLTATMFYGGEKVNNSPYQSMFYSGATSVEWSNILGGNVEASRGPLTVRAVYVQADVSTVNSSQGVDQNAKMKAYGLAANLDFDKWFMLSEITQMRRDFPDQQGVGIYHYRAPAYTLGAGVRLGKWVPFLNYARYTEDTSNYSIYQPTSYDRVSLTGRYDIDSNSAFKLQLEKERDITQTFGGDVTVLRASYDRVF